MQIEPKEPTTLVNLALLLHHQLGTRRWEERRARTIGFNHAVQAEHSQFYKVIQF